MDRTESKLKYFFVFTPKDVREGEEHKKILFFHPSDMPVEEQTKHIGLAEAFLSKFSSETPCETVHYEKHTAAFHEGEKEYWMVMTVTNPSVVKQKEGKAATEYKESDIDDIALQSVVKQAYRMFKLFNGSFRNIVKISGEEILKTKLTQFYNNYLPSLRFEQSDLFNTLEGVHFLPVDKNIYLRIQCFINLTENTFNKIQYSAFLYRDHLVWSALDQDDMRSLYKYLVQFLIPYMSESSTTSSTPSLINVSKSQKGFITGVGEDTPKIFVSQPEQAYQLVIYKLQEILCIFVVENSHLEESFFKNLGAFVSHQLDFLIPILEDHYAKKHNFEDQYKYVYFNHMNFALKTSMKEKGIGVRRDSMKMLNDIHTDFETAPDNLTEVLIRTQNDKWVVGRKSDQREFYVIFDNKNSLLIEINEEVKKLSSAYFNNIFID